MRKKERRGRRRRIVQVVSVGTNIKKTTHTPGLLYYVSADK